MGAIPTRGRANQLETPPPYSPPTIPTMIYTLASDRESQQVFYVSSDNDGTQRHFAGELCIHEGWWFAGCHADKWHDEAMASIPTFEV